MNRFVEKKTKLFFYARTCSIILLLWLNFHMEYSVEETKIEKCISLSQSQSILFYKMQIIWLFTILLQYATAVKKREKKPYSIEHTMRYIIIHIRAYVFRVLFHHTKRNRKDNEKNVVVIAASSIITIRIEMVKPASLLLFVLFLSSFQLFEMITSHHHTGFFV